MGPRLKAPAPIPTLIMIISLFSYVTRTLPLTLPLRLSRLLTGHALVVVTLREVRLGTASLATGSDGKFIDVQKLNFKKFVRRPALAVVSLLLLDRLQACRVLTGGDG